jgi:transposase
MKTGVISLTREQHDRLDTINKANAGFITVKEAAERLGISERQIQRLKKEVGDKGPAALIHKNTNRKPAHSMTDELKAKILEIRKKPGYKEANYNHFLELLDVRHQIKISYSALHRLLTADGQNSPKKRRRFKKHRRRKRREQAGELVQIDASPYDWLSIGRKLEMHGCIDDATGQTTGLYLCKNECMLGYHEVMRRTVGVFGVPDSIYADRHTIFRSPNADKAKAVDAPPDMKVNETQFGRAMTELGVKIIAARSPQAKGRIERLWETLQSRLPVEFEIAGIKDIDAANAFLSSYIFAYNSEFAVEPEDGESAFLPLEDGQDLNHILCVKETRKLDSSQVFSYDGKKFQIEKSAYSNWIPPKAEITVMISPYIGIKAAYKNMVFETQPYKDSKKQKTVTKETAEKPAVDPSIYRSANAWDPPDGMQWQPGLPTYWEVFEIVQGIFEKPYGNAKRKTPTIPYAASGTARALSEELPEYIK